jgi:hypothetical protein
MMPLDLESISVGHPSASTDANDSLWTATVQTERPQRRQSADVVPPRRRQKTSAGVRNSVEAADQTIVDEKQVASSNASRPLTSSTTDSSDDRISRIADHLKRRRRRRRSIRFSNLPFVVPIQFYLSTRVPETDGAWPDEFHAAADRLYAMFDAVDRRFVAGDFDVALQAGGVRDTSDEAKDIGIVEPVADSLASAHVRSVCDVGYYFNETILLCG